MKGGARVAAGVSIGYFLGRTHKMRLALMLAGAGLTGRLPNNPQDILKRGASMVGSSPELVKITDSVRGELMSAARAAAVTAASNRIDSLNERLQQRATGRPKASEEEPEEEEYADEGPEDEYAEGEYEPAEESAEEEYPEEETDEEEAPEEGEGAPEEAEEAEEEAPKPARRRPAARRRTGESTSRPKTSRAKSKAKEPEESGDEDEEPAKPRRRSTRAEASASGRAPVRRTRK
ncbi:hypothetical protein D092_14950 [Rhodococcus ruber Chol-4]|uniref:Uncharacterized protein n=1 Tax=Rhodococcus ruber TaxID=1830 RepID=A0A098BNJ6_9NOCA|nr:MULTISPECIES: hypothetical protein [Rhodococcus]AXY54796.1 hypothetical protein YT1_5407 [Rhodococcus ruber]KXF85626.1 hypothetical protein D092_14950 [Rhodococcus ruber Chol-4]MCD2125178.1 hypothetical protein [Rhodococcus ruber]MCZ1072527.1 hypothetical protein [Rhodococcus sp. A5(2022)]MCZ4501383.1 hypothetical protein [Rhodococcus ruber]